MEKVLVAMHGYSQKVPDGYRPWKEVVKDRLSATLEVAEFFKELGCKVEIMISGGTVYQGKVEAEAIYEFAQENFPGIEDYEVRLETKSRNTAENVERIYEIAEKEKAGAIVPISSRDHTPRVMRDFCYHEKRPRIEDALLLGCASNEPYSEAGWSVQPAIVEPPVRFGNVNLAELVPKFFRVPGEKREKFSREMEEVLKKYGAIL